MHWVCFHELPYRCVTIETGYFCFFFIIPAVKNTFNNSAFLPLPINFLDVRVPENSTSQFREIRTQGFLVASLFFFYIIVNLKNHEKPLIQTELMLNFQC